MNQSPSRLSPRAFFLIAVAGAALLALSSLFLGPAARMVTADDKAAAGQNDKKSDDPATTARKATTVEYVPQPTRDEQKILDTLRNPTTVEFVDCPLEDCVTFLKDYHNLNVWLDKAALEKEKIDRDQPVTLKLADASLRSVLHLILGPAKLTYLVEDDVMKITTLAGANKFITRTYPVSDLYRGRVDGDEKAIAEKPAPGGQPAARDRGDLEKAILSAISPNSWGIRSGSASCTYVEKSGSLVIRQSWMAHAMIVELLRDLREAKGNTNGATVDYLPRPTKIEQKILDALRKPTTVDFLDLPFDDCVTFLSQYHKIPMWLDKKTLLDEGVAYDQPITLKLKDISLRSVLRLILEPMSMSYVVADDVMQFSAAPNAMITRTYPVGDLCQERMIGDDKASTNKTVPGDKIGRMLPGDLEKAIVKEVESVQSFTFDGSRIPGSITYVQESRSLVISHAAAAHEKILALLRDLREAKVKPGGDKK